MTACPVQLSLFVDIHPGCIAPLTRRYFSLSNTQLLVCGRFPFYSKSFVSPVEVMWCQGGSWVSMRGPSASQSLSRTGLNIMSSSTCLVVSCLSIYSAPKIRVWGPSPWKCDMKSLRKITRVSPIVFQSLKCEKPINLVVFCLRLGRKTPGRYIKTHYTSVFTTAAEPAQRVRGSTSRLTFMFCGTCACVRVYVIPAR